MVDISPDRDWILIETDTMKPYTAEISENLYRGMSRMGSLIRVDELHRIMLTREFEGVIGQRVRVDSRRFYRTNYFFDNVRQKSLRKVSFGHIMVEFIVIFCETKQVKFEQFHCLLIMIMQVPI